MARRKRALLCATPYLSLYRTASGFYYAERKNVDSVAALCFRTDPKSGECEFLVHYQVMPEIAQKKSDRDMYACPITGSFEKGDDPARCAIREIYEEGGIRARRKHLVAMNRSIATTQMNEQIYHAVFDVTGLEQTDPPTDGSYFESLAKNRWLTRKQLERIVFGARCVKLNSLATCYALWEKFCAEKNDK